jgi:hypothetical protein
MLEEQGMSEAIVTVGRYTHPLAAQLAYSRLQAEGIRASLTGDLPSDIFPGNALMTLYQLQVTESDRERALAVLAEEELAQLDPEWEANVEKESGWVCSLCGSAVRDGLEVCPDCLTERGAVMAPSPVTSNAQPSLPPGVPSDALQKFRPATPPDPRVSEPSEPDDEVELPEEDDLRVDSALAHRAYLAAVIGSFLCGCLTIYSLTLLYRLSDTPEKLTPRASRKAWLALIINITWCFLWAVLVIELIRYW